MDPSGFRMMLGPLLVARCLPCTALQYALEYLGNVLLTSLLVVVAFAASSQVPEHPIFLSPGMGVGGGGM